jgi:hypothetical protein
LSTSKRLGAGDRRVADLQPRARHPDPHRAVASVLHERVERHLCAPGSKFTVAAGLRRAKRQPWGGEASSGGGASGFAPASLCVGAASALAPEQVPRRRDQCGDKRQDTSAWCMMRILGLTDEFDALRRA